MHYRDKLFSFLSLAASLLSFSVISAGPVGLEFGVNTNKSVNQNNPEVLGLNDGGFVISWESYYQDGSQSSVYSQFYNDSGAQVGSEQRVNTFTRLYQNEQSMTQLLNGDIVIVWASTGQYINGDKRGIYSQKYNSQGVKLGSENQIHSLWGNAGLADEPTITSLPNGGYAVAWSSPNRDGSGDTVIAQIFSSDDQKIGGEFIVNSFTSGAQHYPSIKSLENGNFLIAWRSYGADGSFDSVQGKIYNSDGTVVVDEFQINTESLNHQSFQDIAIQSGGDIVAAYQSHTDVFIKKLNSVGQVLVDEKSVEVDMGGKIMPTTTTLNDDRVVVSWTDRDTYQMYGRIFDENLTPVSEAFKVNSSDGYVTGFSDIHSLEDGGFVVVWASYQQDEGGTRGIYGQRFNQFGEPIELEPPVVNVGFSKQLSDIHDENNDGQADKIKVFVPETYEYRLSLDDLNTTQLSDELLVVDALPGWTLVNAVPSVGLVNTQVTDGTPEYKWELMGTDISTPGNAFVDVTLRESCGAYYVGGEAVLKRKPAEVDSFITVDTDRPQICLARIFDANGDGVIQYNGSGDENNNGMSDYVEACEMQLDPCLQP